MESTHTREPWNKGKLIGQKPPLKPKDIWAIRIQLQNAHQVRDQAMFNLAIDSKLRGCDLVNLRVRDVTHGNQVLARAMIVQRKTQRPVQFELTEPTRAGYHPAVLLKLYIYGYLNRVQSSRRLEKEAQRNVELMWLTGRLMPDFKTIADFRKDNGKAIRSVCRQFVVLWETGIAPASIAPSRSTLRQRADPLPLVQRPQNRPAQIQFIDEDIDYSNRIGFSYVIVKRLGQQYTLRPAFTLNKSLHKSAPLVDTLIRISTHATAPAFTSDTMFSHSLGQLPPSASSRFLGRLTSEPVNLSPVRLDRDANAVVAAAPGTI